VIDDSAVIQAPKAHRLGGPALDTYEAEGELFYYDVLMRMTTLPNFFTCSTRISSRIRP